MTHTLPHHWRSRVQPWLMLLAAASAIAATTQDPYIASDVIPLAGKEGISWQTRGGDYLFKPYVLVQTRLQGQYYDDEGLDLSDADNVANSGFAIPTAIMGMSGKAFGLLTFNLTLNAASSGGALLNQAWFDINQSDAVRIRFGKFKTPAHTAYLTQIGQTLFPLLPASLSTQVNVPYSLNSVNPTLATGFDNGIQLHGILGGKWDYRAGIFNGTGITVNDAQKTLSDDLYIPSMLYAARLGWMPFGPMPVHQGDPGDLVSTRMLIAASASYNVEAEWESSNDLRSGLEFALLHNRLFLSAEGYLLAMDFVEQQRISEGFLFWGAYAQLGYFVTPTQQPALRFDVLDRNGVDEKGMLLLPAVGWNWYLAGYSLKLQAMYQYLAKVGHASTYDANDDDNGMAEHQVIFQSQFAF